MAGGRNSEEIPSPHQQRPHGSCQSWGIAGQWDVCRLGCRARSYVPQLAREVCCRAVGGDDRARRAAFRRNSAVTLRTTCEARYARLVSSKNQPLGQNGRYPDRRELSLKFKTTHNKLPGTEDARKLGCTCRDPARVLSKGAALRAGWLRDLVSDDCPLHEVVIGTDDA